MDVSNVKENIEFRKVQITGKSSYIISLPKNWIKNNKIKKGDTIAVIEEDEGELKISKVLETKKKEKPAPKILMDNFSDSELITAILGNYIIGVDNLEILSEKKEMNPAQKKVAVDTIRNLIGFEVMSESPNVIKIKNLLEPSDFNLDEVVNRLALISISMFKTAMNAIVELNPKKVEDMETQDDEVDRLYLLIQRLLNIGIRDKTISRKIGLDSNGAAMGWSTVVRSIERIADASVEIAQQIEPLQKFKIPVEILNLYTKLSKESISLIDEILAASSRKDPRVAIETVRKIDKLIKLREDARKTESEKSMEPKLLVSLGTINCALREVLQYSLDYLKVIINSEYWQHLK
ncbi:MAG: PhoU domain-containing protein [Candidatus Jordarchaeum sp.]|uniref:PhoU domain-containing protein n=1 Tax=Candidatus Jordarchaeum sp. TaxID=2823881 RepID=UPI00404B7B47